jgi:hypothetical protein
VRYGAYILLVAGVKLSGRGLSERLLGSLWASERSVGWVKASGEWVVSKQKKAALERIFNECGSRRSAVKMGENL